MDKVSLFIFNVFLNSLLAFFTALLLIEVVLFIFRIKQGRVAASLRMIPIFKLPLDLSLYDFSRWSYLQGVNPLHCEKGTRNLSIMLGSNGPLRDCFFLPTQSEIKFSILPGNMTFSFADIIGCSMNPWKIKIFSTCLVFLCLCFLIRKLVRYRGFVRTINYITINSEYANRKIRNPHLIARIKKGKYSIFTSSALSGSPFVTGLFSPMIYIPSLLFKSLSRKEYEAVLAHEIEHIRNRDVFIRSFLDITSSIFWWVPTKRLRNLIEEGQEISCDCQCRKYGVDSIDLAAAICKSAKHAKSLPSYAFCLHFTQHRTIKRLKILLKPLSQQFQKVRIICSCLAATIAFLQIFLGRFWVF